MTELGRISTAARVFTLAALGSICIVSGLRFQGLGLVIVVAVFAQTLEPSRKVPAHVGAAIEGALAATVAVVAFPHNEAVLPYLPIPVLIGGLAYGLRAVALVTAAEATLLAVTWWSWVGYYDQDMFASCFTWLVTAIGLGLIGTLFRRTMLTSGVDASYRSALNLIQQLHALSGKLTSGLDPVSIAEDVIASAAGVLMIRDCAVLLRAPSGEFAPLLYSDGAGPGSMPFAEGLAQQCWTSGEVSGANYQLAIPLAVEAQVVAILVVDCAMVPDPLDVRELTTELASDAVRLSAALLFTDVRNTATSEERQRLAREVHDGVAQDVASLGYLVDNLAATTTDPDQVAQVTSLRGEVTRVVGELRNSVFDLRNQVGVGQGLGQSIATFARHVGAHSAMTIHFTLDESTTRLRPEIEAELLRIAQEAINNARRHSNGTNLWVTCTVHPPYAEIEVVDDGTGLGAARPDSHGLRIMRERATRIDARFKVESPTRDGHGTRLSVRVGTPAARV